MTEKTEHAELQIAGMRCASCSARLEKSLNELPYVTAVVNIATEKASLTYDPTRTDLETILETVRHTGFDAHPARDFAAVLRHEEEVAEKQAEAAAELDALIAALQGLCRVLRQRGAPVAIVRYARRCIAAPLRWQIGDLHYLRWRHHGQPVAQVFQLPHVAGEILRGEILQCRIAELFLFDGQFARAFLQKVFCQQRNVFAAFAQRRQAQADHVQPMEQVFAE